jgi:hypothetical protein
VTRRWRRAGLVGLVIFVVYLATVSATIAFRHDHVRPLYDGLTPDAPYRYVEPPVIVASENVKPTAMSTTIALGAGGSAAAGVATPDGQFVISLARGAVTPAAGATAISVRITPLDPHKLAPVPGKGLKALGNTYRLEITYEPSGQAVTRLAKPGTLLLQLPDIAQHEFLSPDGKQWSSIPARLVGTRSMTTSLRVPAYYVAATAGPTLAFRARQSSHAAIVVGLVVVLVALLLFLGVYLAKAGAKPKQKKQQQKLKHAAR